ncbi:MAG: hypothetical protein ACJA1P_001851 [Maribacter sp.]|jgi:hypothetical protein|tara:strand:+ start:560 stop:787 length:228 start_codon:yes stop_codon:yes gene_type:complete
MKPHFLKQTFFYSLAIVFISLSTSCSKEHDLISDYMISNTTEISLEQKTTTTLLSNSKKPEQVEHNANLTETRGK